MAIKDLLIRLRLKGAKKAKGDLGGVDSSMKTLAKSAVVAAGSFYALKKAWDFTVELKNFARDAEETTNKFKTVFSSMDIVATRTAKTLADSYGLAHTTAMELLGDTGDILVGFGFTEESALELSKKVQELSVDLASFTNYAGGASGASSQLGSRKNASAMRSQICTCALRQRIMYKRRWKMQRDGGCKLSMSGVRGRGATPTHLLAASQFSSPGDAASWRAFFFFFSSAKAFSFARMTMTSMMSPVFSSLAFSFSLFFFFSAIFSFSVISFFCCLRASRSFFKLSTFCVKWSSRP